MSEFDRQLDKLLDRIGLLSDADSHMTHHMLVALRRERDEALEGWKQANIFAETLARQRDELQAILMHHTSAETTQ